MYDMASVSSGLRYIDRVISKDVQERDRMVAKQGGNIHRRRISAMLSVNASESIGLGIVPRRYLKNEK
jgi:hypothetical protein